MKQQYSMNVSGPTLAIDCTELGWTDEPEGHEIFNAWRNDVLEYLETNYGISETSPGNFIKCFWCEHDENPWHQAKSDLPDMPNDHNDFWDNAPKLDDYI